MNDIHHSTELPCHETVRGESRLVYMFTHSHAEIQSEVKCRHMPLTGGTSVQDRLTCQSRDQGG